VPGTSIIDPDDLLAALATADVVVTNTSVEGGEEDGDITVAAALAWSSGQTLTLDAFDDIIIGEAITISAGGGLELLAGGGISLDAPIAAPGGTLSVAADGTIT